MSFLFAHIKSPENEIIIGFRNTRISYVDLHFTFIRTKQSSTSPSRDFDPANPPAGYGYLQDDDQIVLMTHVGPDGASVGGGGGYFWLRGKELRAYHSVVPCKGILLYMLWEGGGGINNMIQVWYEVGYLIQIIIIIFVYAIKSTQSFSNILCYNVVDKWRYRIDNFHNTHRITICQATHWE